MIGQSPAIENLRTLITRVAPTDVPVLITGETGTGKELVARALHNQSPRASTGAFVAINCGAVPRELMESALFGHVKGAFTGATENCVGMYPAADRGTIFLDEIAEMPLDMQVKLLRVIERGEYMPVGTSHERIADVRVVCATNRDIEAEVGAGRFREDLYYRINVIKMHVPPLRERLGDVPLLVWHFIGDYNAENPRNPAVTITEAGMARMVEQAKSLRGNIRELQSLVQRAAVLAEGDVIIAEPGSLGDAWDGLLETRPDAAIAYPPLQQPEEAEHRPSIPTEPELIKAMKPHAFRFNLRLSPQNLVRMIEELTGLQGIGQMLGQGRAKDLVTEARLSVVSEHLAHGMKGTEIAEIHGISHMTFMSLRKLLKQRHAEDPEAS